MSYTRSTMQGSYNANDSNDALIDFFESFDAAHEYPTNLVYSHRYDYQLQECQRQLDVNDSKLFGDEDLVDFLQTDGENPGMWYSCLQQTFVIDSRQASIRNESRLPLI